MGSGGVGVNACISQRFDKKSRAKQARSKSEANTGTASASAATEDGEVLPAVGDLVEYILSAAVKADLQVFSNTLQ